MAGGCDRVEQFIPLEMPQLLASVVPQHSGALPLFLCSTPPHFPIIILMLYLSTHLYPTAIYHPFSAGDLICTYNRQLKPPERPPSTSHCQSCGLLMAVSAPPPSTTQPTPLPPLGVGPSLAPLSEPHTLSHYFSHWYIQQFLSTCKHTQRLPSLKILSLPTFSSNSCLLSLPPYCQAY